MINTQNTLFLNLWGTKMKNILQKLLVGPSVWPAKSALVTLSAMSELETQAE